MRHETVTALVHSAPEVLQANDVRLCIHYPLMRWRSLIARSGRGRFPPSGSGDADQHQARAKLGSSVTGLSRSPAAGCPHQALRYGYSANVRTIQGARSRLSGSRILIPPDCPVSVTPPSPTSPMRFSGRGRSHLQQTLVRRCDTLVTRCAHDRRDVLTCLVGRRGSGR
jgi:hypothetical protein